MFAARPVASDVQIMTVLVVSFRQKNPTCVDRAWTTTQLYISSKSRRTDRMIRMTNRSKNDCNSFSQSPEHEGLSWPHKIGRFAQSLWQSPKHSMIVLLQQERSNRWRMGTLNEKPAMQILADFYLTNITHEDVFVLKTYFVPYNGTGWFPSSLPVDGNILVKNRIVTGGTPGRHKIPPGFTYEAHADWWVQPPIKREGQTLRGRGCFVDQFDNEYWTAVLNWKYW